MKTTRAILVAIFAVSVIPSMLFADAYTWLFNGSTTEGWTMTNIDGFVVSGSYFRMNPGASDPRIASPSLNLTPSAINYMKLGIINNGGDNHGEVFWVASGFPASGSRKANFTCPNDGIFHIPVIRLDNIPEWNTPPIIDQVRLDPVWNGTGGNDSILIDFIFLRYDLHAPNTPTITSVNPSGWTKGAITINFESNDPSDFSGVGPDQYGSGIADFRYRVDPQPDQVVLPYWSDIWEGTTRATITYNPGSLAAGPNRFHVYCFDKIGRVCVQDAQVWLYYDPQSPSVPSGLVAIPPSSSTNSFSFDWNASSDFGLSGVSGYYWKVNNGSETFVPAAQTSLGAGPRAQFEGNNRFIVRAVDNVGNYSNPDTVLFFYFVPTIASSPQQMEFTANSNGEMPDGQSFDLSNTGTGTLEWSLTDDADWLDVSPTNGTGNLQSINVSVNTTNLPESVYTAAITVTSDDADNSPYEIMVTYNVETCCIGIRGDVNGDGVDANILDLTFIIDRIFRNGPPAPCADEADVNGDGSSTNIVDLTFLVDYIFRGGALPGPC